VPTILLHLHCNEDVLIQRLLPRGRLDDNVALVQKRLDIFKTSTSKVIEYYDSQAKVCLINGESSRDAVFEEAVGVLKQTLSHKSPHILRTLDLVDGD
jgi:adenylate kinase family enzyme